MPDGTLQTSARTSALAVELPNDSRSPARARRLVRDAAEAWGLGHLVDDAALVVSELATNVMLHARSGMRVSVEPAPDGLRIGVLDRSARAVVPRTPGLESGTGRGTFLVELLAAEWGSAQPAGDLRDEGWAKEVWAVLR